MCICQEWACVWRETRKLRVVHLASLIYDKAVNSLRAGCWNGFIGCWNFSDFNSQWIHCFSGGARSLKLGGGGTISRRRREPLGWSGGMLPRENFEIWNPWNAISWIFRVVMKWVLKIIKQLEHTIFHNSTRVFVRPGYIDKSYRPPPPPLFLIGFGRIGKLVSVRNGAGGRVPPSPPRGAATALLRHLKQKPVSGGKHPALFQRKNLEPFSCKNLLGSK